MTPSLKSRYLGMLLGLACGDAVGTTVEFSQRGSFAQLTDMMGGGPFGLKPGQWTDDTSMALCLAESLLTKGVFDPKDQMTRYLNWWQWGYLSSTGECFDIGMTVQAALARFQVSGNPFSGSTDPATAGNGSLMRLAPIVLFAYPDRNVALLLAAESSRTTHAAPEAVECCRAFAALLHALLGGAAKGDVTQVAAYASSQPKIAAILNADLTLKHQNDVRGTGYSVASLEAALWCFLTTESFKEAVLKAANLGDDADTTAAIVGQLAGACYGVEAIPATWLAKLAMRDDIAGMAESLYAKHQRDVAPDI